MELIAVILIVGGVVYFFASAKSRRVNAVELRIKRMVSAGIHSSTFSDLYYEAAKGYAISKGATSSDIDSASALTVINGQVYFIVFIKNHDGGTMINIRPSKDVEESIERSILSSRQM